MPVMSQKVEIEIGIKDRFTKEFEGIRENVGKSAALIDGLKQKTAELIAKFEESAAEANRLKGELKGLAESGASPEILIAKMNELADAERKAANEAATALDASGKYWTALNLAGGDITEVQERHLLLNQSYKDIADSANKTQAVIDDYSRKLKEAKKGTDEVTESTKELKDTAEKASKSSKGLADDISKIPGPLGDSAKGMKALTKETLVFLATPLGMTLAAISAGLALVSSWFHRTEEGEEAMNVATARFTGTLNTLLDVADDVGEWLYKAFTDPLGAIDDLWHNLKDKVLADMKRVAEMGAGIVKIFSGDVGGGLAQAKSAWDGIGLGGIKQRAGENAAKQADIARRQNALDREQREWIVEREKKETRISELRAKIYDSTVKEAEKANAIKEAKKLTNELYDKEVSMAKEQHAIIADTNSLSHSSIADRKKEQEALAKTISLERQRNDSLRMFNRNESSLSNKAASAAKKEQRESEEEAKRRQKLFDLEIEQRNEQAKLERESLSSINKAKIAQIANDAARQRAEEDEQHRLDMEAIEERAEEMRKKRYEAMKSEWEATNKDKTKVWADTSLAKDVAENGYKNIKLNDSEERQLQAERVAAEEEYRRLIQQRQKDEKQALTDYIKEYGSIQDRKRAISEEYAQKIADEEDVIRKRALEAERDRIISELDFKELKESIDWESVFGDLSRRSVSALRELKAKLRQALDAKDITAENAKVLSEKILEIENVITDKTDIFASMLPGLRERKRLTEQATAAEELYRKSLDSESDAINKVLEDKRKIQDLLKDVQVRDAFGNKITVELEAISEENKEKLLASLDKDSDLYKQLLQLFKNLAADTTEANQKHEATDQKRNYAKELKDSLNSGSVKQVLNDLFNFEGMGFTEIASLVDRNAQSLAEFVDKIGLEGTDFGDAVHGFADGVSGFNSAIQSLASGDVFGAVNGIIDGVAGFGKSIGAVFGINWSGGNEEEVAEKDEKLIHANENLQRSIDALKESFDKYNGMNAIETSTDIVKKQAEYNKNVMERFINDMGYHSAHHSNNYYWDGFSQSQISAMNALLSSRGYNERINNNDWTALTVLSPEALNDIRTYLPEIWDFITSRGKYGWVYDSLNEYADQAGKIAEQEEALRENLSQLSKTSLHDSFVSDLMDMTKKAEDFGDDFKEILMKAVLNAQIGTLLDDDLEAWRADMAKRMEMNGGTLTETDIEQLRADWDSIVSKGMEVRNQVSAITGYTQKEAEATNASIDIIKDAFKSLVADTSQDMREWSKNLKNSIIDSLVETMIFGDEFQAWAKEWVTKFNNVWTAYSEGKLSKGIFADIMVGFNSELDDMAASTAEKVKAIKESLGYAFGGDGELETAFSDLRGMFLDTLTDMEGDAEGFRRKLNEIMVKDLIDKQVFGQAFTIGNGTFKDFQAYLDYWNEEYAEAVEHGDQSRIDALLDELVRAREITLQSAEELRDRLKSVADDDTFKGMSDNWVSTLMDMSKTADDWAKDISRTMAQRIVEQMVVPTMIQPVLDSLQSVFNAAMESGVSVDSNGNKSYDWWKVLGNDSLKAALADIKEQYPDIQGVIKDIMDALGLDTSVERKFKYGGFSSLRDSFLDTLSSMEGDAEAFGSKIGKEMAGQMAQAYVDKTYGDELSGLQTKWQEALESGNTAAMDAIREAIKALYISIGNDQSLKSLVDGFREEAEKPLPELRETFIDTLLDMDADADTFGKRIGSTLMRQMLDQMLDDRYASRMDSIRDHWRQALEGVGGYTIESVTAEIEALNGEINNDDAIRKLTDAYKELNMELEKSDETFKSMGDSFTSMLLDMDAKASDLGNDIGQTLAKKIVGSLIVEKELQRYLDDIQKAYDEAIGKNGATTDSVLAAVLPKIETAVAETEKWKPVTEEIAKMFTKMEEEFEETPFDNFRSSFLSSLMDMEADTKDFADDIAKLLTEAFIDQFVLGDEFDALLEEWKKRYSEIMGDKSLSVEQRTKALNDLKGIIADARDGLAEEARAIQNLMGTSAHEDQRATMNTMAEAATYDQFETYLGIAMGQQMALEQGNEVRQHILATLQAMGGIASPGSNYQEQIFNRLGTTNDYLLTIRDEIRKHLGQIASYTSNLTKL